MLVPQKPNSEKIKMTGRNGEINDVNDFRIDSEGKPLIKFIPFDIAINPRTKKDYNELMRVLECGGLTWFSGDLPTKTNHLNIYGKETTISFENRFSYCSAEEYREMGYIVISTKEFYNTQKMNDLTKKIINESFENKK